MQIGALVQTLVDDRKPERAAEIARQVEQAGTVLQPLRRQRAERDVVVGTIANIMPMPRRICGISNWSKSIVAGDPGHRPGAEPEDDGDRRR